MVVALNAGARVRNTKNQNSKGKLGACPCLSLFYENSQLSDDSLRGTVRRGANRSCLPEDKLCSQPEADGSNCGNEPSGSIKCREFLD